MEMPMHGYLPQTARIFIQGLTPYHRYTVVRIVPEKEEISSAQNAMCQPFFQSTFRWPGR